MRNSINNITQFYNNNFSLSTKRVHVFLINFDLFNSEGVFFDKQQIVLEKLLSITLGDRQETSITINGNTVSVNDKSINIPSH